MRRFLTAASLFLVASLAAAAGREPYRVCWSHYTGWEPWGYAAEHGIVKKWAAREGIDIEVVRVDDYMDSVTQYTAGKFAGCAMTNMDALAIPAAGGVDSTALIVGSFSNGNDGILLKQGTRLADLKGRQVRLVSLSVSHYLLDRALEMSGLAESDLELVNSNEAEIEGGFRRESNAAAVTWNPVLLRLKRDPGARLVFDSTRIPGEIMDLMVVRTDAPAALKRALTGAWYEVLGLMKAPGKTRGQVLAALARSSGTSQPEFLAQLATTRLFYDRQEAARFADSAGLRETMERVRTFAFKHDLYGEGARSKDVVGIAFATGKPLGDGNNVKLRFDPRYMAAAAAGGK